MALNLKQNSKNKVTHLLIAASMIFTPVADAVANDNAQDTNKITATTGKIQPKIDPAERRLAAQEYSKKNNAIGIFVNIAPGGKLTHQYIGNGIARKFENEGIPSAYSHVYSSTEHTSVSFFVNGTLYPYANYGLDKVIEGYKLAADYYTTIQSANHGDAEAQFEMGLIYYLGRRVARDYKIAADWFLKASSQKLAKAQDALGIMYANGKYFKEDGVVAAQWFMKAANQGHTRSEYMYGLYKWFGTKVPKDRVGAFKYFQKAAKSGHLKSTYRVGVMYLYGDGVKLNNDKAAKWLLEAASQGHTKSQYLIGQMYYNGLSFQKDDIKALKWYLKAANSGDMSAMYIAYNIQRIAEAERKMRNIEKNSPQFKSYNLSSNTKSFELILDLISHDEATNWLAKAARLGDEDAQRECKKKRLPCG